MTGDARTAAVLLGAAILVAAMFAPWYAIDLSPAARGAIDARTGQIPGVLGELARQLLSVLPDRIKANAWQVFERSDVVMLGSAIAAAVTALLGRRDVAGFAGVVAVATVGLAIVDQPGPNALVELQWGAWLGLGGTLLLLAGAWIPAGTAPVATLSSAGPPAAWAPPVAPRRQTVDAARSVPPPGS